MHIFKNKPLPKRHYQLKVFSMSLLGLGAIFLFEALTRINIVSVNDITYIDMTTLTPFFCLFSCFCALIGERYNESSRGLRWATASVILLTIGLTLLFEEIANYGSDVFFAFNFVGLVITSSLLCIVGIFFVFYSGKYKVEIAN